MKTRETDHQKEGQKYFILKYEFHKTLRISYEYFVTAGKLS